MPGSKRPRNEHDDNPTSRHCPTPAEIRRACLKIQASWTREQEIYRRTGLSEHERPQHWTPPLMVPLSLEST